MNVSIGDLNMQRSQTWPTTRSTLLSQLRDADDSHAWSRFVDLYLPLIHRFARRRGLQDADARDVSQDVLLQVSRAIRTFEYNPGRGRFRSWLGLITHQRILRHRARANAAVCGLGDGQGDSLSTAVPSEVEGEWRDAFHAHVYRMARECVRQDTCPEMWRAFEMVWEDGCSPQRAAEVLERPPHWVYQARYRVLQRLKQCVMDFSAENPL